MKYYTDLPALKLRQAGNSPKKKKDSPLTPDGNLTTAEKKRILLNNIFGVDIDAQAVEVTKLNLLLKALEGETQSSISQQLSLFHERVLPNLNQNIKCGNSLIGSDFYDDQLDLFPEQMKKINAFDWKEGFPEIFKQGGFDAVIGNPPYVFTRDVEFGEAVKDYYKPRYLNLTEKSSRSRENQTGKVNLFGIFTIKGVQLLNKKGLMGFIIPNTILRTTIYEGVRKYLLEYTSIEQIVDLKAGVFEGVTASTVILVVGRDLNKDTINIIDNPKDQKPISAIQTTSSKKSFLKNPSNTFNIFVNTNELQLFEKISAKSEPLSFHINVSNGIATFKGKQGITEQATNDISKKIIFGKDIKRYGHQWNGKFIEYIPKKLQRARNENIFLADEKLIMQRIGGILVTSYDDEQFYTFNSVNNLLLKDGSIYSLKYILALLNSKLLKFYYVQNFTNKSSLTVNISKTFLDRLPICRINFEHTKMSQVYYQIVKLVDNVLKLNEQLQATKLETQRQQIQRTIDHTEKKIDELVYGLYELSEEEIEIVEHN